MIGISIVSVARVVDGVDVTPACTTFARVPAVKHSRKRGTSRISTKHQVTIPVAALREAGLEPGDRVLARAEGSGRVVLEREHDVLGEFAGVLTGTYERAELRRLRDEWR